MLVLSRKESQRVRLGKDIVLTIVRVSGDKVRLGIEAPSDLLILREELDSGQNPSVKAAAYAYRTKIATASEAASSEGFPGKRRWRLGSYRITVYDCGVD